MLLFEWQVIVGFSDYANGMATQEGGCVDPLLMVGGGLLSGRCVRVTNGAFAIDHDQDAIDASAICALGAVKARPDDVILNRPRRRPP